MFSFTPKGQEDYQKNVAAYHAAYKRRDPCDWCGRQHPNNHHATVYGENICHWCYENIEGKVCTQLYPGDWGGSIM